MPSGRCRRSGFAEYTQARRPCPVVAAVNAAVQVLEPSLQVPPVSPPAHPVHPCRRILRQPAIGQLQQGHIDAMEQRRELILLFPRCLPYPVPARGTRSPGPVSGACRARPRSPQPPPGQALGPVLRSIGSRRGRCKKCHRPARVSDLTGRRSTGVGALRRVACRHTESVGIPDRIRYAAQYRARRLRCQRFTPALAAWCA